MHTDREVGILVPEVISLSGYRPTVWWKIPFFCPPRWTLKCLIHRQLTRHKHPASRTFKCARSPCQAPLYWRMEDLPWVIPCVIS